MAENKEKKEESKIEYIEESEISGLSLEKKIIKLKEKFKKCREEKEEYLMGWQRAKADFINFKKESEGLMVDFRKWANENLIEEILPILDNFYRAESHLPDMKLRKVDWVKGIIQIKSQLEEFLKKQGLEEIKTLGEEFNPEFHEAVEEIKKEGEKSGKIIKEVQKGYLLQGKVIRSAKVRIVK